MINPTVGRVVLLKNRPGALCEQPEAAIVAYVHNDRLVNLAAFNSGGQAYAMTSVKLLQDDDAVPEGMHATWMPYQKGQAAKTEALEAQLAGSAPATA